MMDVSLVLKMNILQTHNFAELVILEIVGKEKHLLAYLVLKKNGVQLLLLVRKIIKVLVVTCVQLDISW